MSTATYPTDPTAENRLSDAPERYFEDGHATRPDGPERPQDKSGAGAMFEEVKDSAQTQLNEKKDVAADQLHNVAGALRDAAQRGAGGDPLWGLTGSAADGLERLSSALRNKDVGVMMRDMESFARAQPVAFFGLALATGFLAVRFLKASQS